MMKTSISLLVFFLYTIGFSQTIIKKSSISTGGGSATVGTTQVIYSIGEVAVQENTQGTTYVSEGFIGPDISQTLGITDYDTLTGISVYPNPVTDRFNIGLPQSGNYEIYLYNLQGKQILFRLSQDIKESIDISRLTSAGYLLVVIDRENKLKKIVKIIKE